MNEGTHVVHGSMHENKCTNHVAGEPLFDGDNIASISELPSQSTW